MTAWEVDWTHPGNTGNKVWARNPTSHIAKAREWHWTTTGHLRSYGVATPTYRTDSWEVDWSKRQAKQVWARNVSSKVPSAREWHWVDQGSMQRVGVQWKPKSNKTGRWTDGNGYVVLSRRGMTADDVELCTRLDLWRGKKKNFVREHHLVVAKKYGAALPAGMVVRHVNGIKDDNRPDNLVLGTTQENTMDHNSARLMAMYWRNKYEELLRSTPTEPTP